MTKHNGINGKDDDAGNGNFSRSRNLVVGFLLMMFTGVHVISWTNRHCTDKLAHIHSATSREKSQNKPNQSEPSSLISDVEISHSIMRLWAKTIESNTHCETWNLNCFFCIKYQKRIEWANMEEKMSKNTDDNTKMGIRHNEIWCCDGCHIQSGTIHAYTKCKFHFIFDVILIYASEKMYFNNLVPMNFTSFHRSWTRQSAMTTKKWMNWVSNVFIWVVIMCKTGREVFIIRIKLWWDLSFLRRLPSPFSLICTHLIYIFRTFSLISHAHVLCALFFYSKHFEKWLCHKRDYMMEHA